MPFDPVKPDLDLDRLPWCKPQAARALYDLVVHLRSVPDDQWYFNREIVTPSDRRGLGKSMCGTVGCALGHAMNVPSCVRLIPQGWRDDRYMSRSAWDEAGLPFHVRLAFFDGGDGGENYPGYANGWDATQYEVADRIDHWLRTGDIV